MISSDAHASQTGRDEETTDAPGRQAKLSTGTIKTFFKTATDSHQIFGFGERINPKRSFVFVSRVLGRHIPVEPRVMRRSFTQLANYLPENLPGPVLMTSMAETAVGLGAGVHDAYLQRTARSDVLNLSSTRAQRSETIFARFSEDHSHASGHVLYQPLNKKDRHLLKSCRSLVMVDDETSSGNTMRSLGKALYDAGLHELQHVFALTLTDWSSADIYVPSDASTSGTVLAERHALLKGHFDWCADPAAPLESLPDPDTPALLASSPIYRTGDARVGNSERTSVCIPAQLLAEIANSHDDQKPILVLGTGEHVWEPFLLAEALEQTGLAVLFSATTRSPIKTGFDISCAYTFKDHEGLGINNYLYNVDPTRFSHIILCLDTSIKQADAALIKALGADVVFDNQLILNKQAIAPANNIASATLQHVSP